MKKSKPFSTDQYALSEFTLRGVILGALITLLFTASNVYLGLKVGLTFSSSIPAAVISMAVLRLFSHSNILENNMVQTQASAAGTLSSVIFILPGLLMIGYWQGFHFWQTMVVCAAGGILGVVFSVPLRHVMVVKSELPYPEGVAAAEILKVGSALSEQERDKSKSASKKQAKKESGFGDIVLGGSLSALFALGANGLRVFSDSVGYWFSCGRAIFQLPMGFSFALLGAGYLIGATAGVAMIMGLLISWGIAVPYLTAITAIPVDTSLADFATGLWKSQVRFIGAGTLAVAAIWTLITLFRPMLEGVKLSFSALRAVKGSTAAVPRTEKDLPARWLIVMTVAMVAILGATFYSFVANAPVSAMIGWLLVVGATLLAVVIGFLVAAACGYMAGLVGSSASPISGIAVIAVIISSLVILAIGEANHILSTIEEKQFATALAIFVTTAVLAIATISNDNLQDLKTGWLIGATPWRQQVALVIGCVVGAFVIAPVLDLLYQAYGFAGALPRADMEPTQILAAPQATLMKTIASGIFSHQLEWRFIIVGLVVGVGLVIVDTLLKHKGKGARLPVLAVGMGMYLPPTVITPIAIGAFLSWYVQWRLTRRAKAANIAVTTLTKPAERRGNLLASGLIVGESLIGVLIAMVIVISISSGGSDEPLRIVTDGFASTAQGLGLICFVAGCAWFVKRVLKASEVG